jgi:cytosine/creatinine deaminase
MLSLNEVNIDPVALPDRAGVFRLSLRDDRIAAIDTSQAGSARWLAIPGLVNLHAHADRSFTVQSFRPRSLSEAITAAAEARAQFTSVDVKERARQLFERSIVHGATRIRTHTDVDPVVELRSMEGVLAAKAEVSSRLDVEIVAFSTSRNDLSDLDALARLKRAVDCKPDFIGASLNASENPRLALDRLLDLAEQTNAPLDLHLDEHLDPDRMLAPMVVDAVIARGLVGRLTLSHLCTLSALSEKPARELIGKLARAQVAVIALPQTNLLLQDRGNGTPRQRGVTLVRELLDGGVAVCFGTDNVRDWFYPFGDGDMLETAQFAVLTTHIDDNAELLGAICDGRHSLSEGAAADLVLIPASSLDDALARRPSQRLVFKRGRQVAGPALEL